MKSITLLTFYCLLANTIFAQNSIIIEFVNEKSLFSQPDFHLYANDSLIYSHCNSKNSGEVLFNLKKGNYKLSYNTIFGVESVGVSFDSNNETKTILIDIEQLAESKLDETESLLEQMEDGEILRIEYKLGACFKEKKQHVTIIKKKNRYYELLNGNIRAISKKRISKLIQYEKIVRNINIEDNLHGFSSFTTCSESISFRKGKEKAFTKNIFCGTWTKSSEISKWLR